jgi:hypothetical protein
VVVVVVYPLVTVAVAVPDFKMFEQKISASDVCPSNAPNPQSLTAHTVSHGLQMTRILLPSGFPNCLFPRTAASAVAASAAVRTESFILAIYKAVVVVEGLSQNAEFLTDTKQSSLTSKVGTYSKLRNTYLSAY